MWLDLLRPKKEWTKVIKTGGGRGFREAFLHRKLASERGRGKYCEEISYVKEEQVL